MSLRLVRAKIRPQRRQFWPDATGQPLFVTMSLANAQRRDGRPLEPLTAKCDPDRVGGQSSGPSRRNVGDGTSTRKRPSIEVTG